jgi:anti-sigma factor RsiW
MTCQGNDDQLGDYVDGALDAAARTAFETHLAGCARCRALAADFQTIHAVTRALEPAAPPAAAWTRIAAAIAGAVVDRPARRWWQFGADGSNNTIWQPAAAMAMAIVLTTGLSWLGGQLGGRLAPASEPARVASVSPALGSAAFGNDELDLAAQEYQREISGLERIAAVDRDALDPETADVLQVNLTVVDTAIGESRAALVNEPANDTAIASLFEALRRKLSLLQDAVALINEMRNGNPEGAARIVSGMNQ